jgi:glycosyltransferase involved in cell wall biosynthesis
MKTLSIVIPAYNEEKGIADIILRVLAVKDDLAHSGIQLAELLVVDDASGDGTAQIAEEIAGQSPCLRVIRHGQNQGYGGALKTGFSEAQGDLIGFLDADGTYPPEYFPQLCQRATEGADLVIGSRMNGAASQMPVTRRIGNIFFASLLTILGRQRVTDSASGMRIFSRSILERIYPLPDGLNLTPVMSTRALHERMVVAEVPIPYSERVGRSKLSVVRDGTLFLQSIVWTVLCYNPVRILGLLGLAGVLFAGLVGAALVAARLNGLTTLSPWFTAALFLALVAGTTGVSLFSLGATFNYLVSIFYKQPIKQGLFGKPIFKRSLDHQFGWMGILSIIAGLILALVVLLQGWEVSRLWLYLLGSAMLVLIGVQLSISWLLMRVLEELSQREILVLNDLRDRSGYKSRDEKNRAAAYSPVSYSG